MTHRPSDLSEFSGQKALSENLALFVSAARSRGESLDHVLLHGPPGLGKTTLAQIISSEMSSAIVQTSAPVLDDMKSIMAILSNLDEGDVLFIDEIHRLPIQVEEVLYSAMEDRKMDLMIGEGLESRSVSIDLPSFTLVGATTRAGSLSKPLFDRFPIVLRLDFYDSRDLIPIIMDEARRRGFDIDAPNAAIIAERSRGTPRVAKRLTARISDFITTHPGMPVDEVIGMALERMGVGVFGIDGEDFRYLDFLRRADRPIGVSTIAAAISETRESIEDVIEPFLLRKGLVSRTSRGRELTDTAKELLDEWSCEEDPHPVDFLNAGLPRVPVLASQ